MPAAAQPRARARPVSARRCRVASTARRIRISRSPPRSRRGSAPQPDLDRWPARHDGRVHELRDRLTLGASDREPNRLVLADALALLGTLAGGSVDLAYADPPFA